MEWIYSGVIINFRWNSQIWPDEWLNIEVENYMTRSECQKSLLYMVATYKCVGEPLYQPRRIARLA